MPSRQKGLSARNLNGSYIYCVECCSRADTKIPHTGDKHLSTNAESSTDAIGGWTKNTPKHDFFEKRKKSPKTQKLRNVQKYDKISDTPFDQRSIIHPEAWFPPCFVKQRIPQNPIFLKTEKNYSKRKNSKTSRNMPKLAMCPLNFEKQKSHPKCKKIKKVQRYAKISDTTLDQRSLIHQEAWFPPCFVRQNQKKKKLFFARRFQTTFKQKCSNLKPLLSITFPKDSKSLKILDIRLREVEAKRRSNGASKVNTRTDGQTDVRTDRRTDRLIESIGPEGRCFENAEGISQMFKVKCKKN